MSRQVARYRVGYALFLFALLAFAVPGFSQTLGEITGHVTDPSSAAIPGVTITLTNVSTNGTRTTVTTDSGDYTFPSVPPGIYNVKTEQSGLQERWKATTSRFRCSRRCVWT